MRGEGYSLSDIAAATGNGNGGFGGDYGAWWIIIIIILFGGWGRNGFGGNSGSGAADNYVLASDFATLQRQLSDGFGTVEKGLDTVRNGLCDGFYTNAQLINGVNTNILQGTNTLNASIKDCCCTTQRSIDSVNFNNAQNTSLITNTMALNNRDVIDAISSSYQKLHEEIVQNRIEDKNAQIQAQQNEINALRLAASQEKQNNYLVNELRPCPRPAYITCNPFASTNYCNCGSGCGM